ncbi:MAG: shikimate dehydrogenase [Acidiferrobacterales bacterium]
MSESRSNSQLYAVMGHPVRHSKSPAIHTEFARQCGIALEYRAIEVEPGSFARAVEEFRVAGGQGLNITVPFKIEAYQLADECSARAELAGAVNTLKFESSSAVYGDNTDGVGLVRDLAINHGIALMGKRVLILGAGGAVRGILGPLLQQGMGSVVIANRTVSKAIELAQAFAAYGDVSGCGFDDLHGQRFDIVINGTAASRRADVPPLPEELFAGQAVAYDLMYGDQPMPFMIWAREHGAAGVIDGLGMLVEQAAESFLLWHGLWPHTGPVIERLRQGSSSGQ